jgi:cytochrome c553
LGYKALVLMRLVKIAALLLGVYCSIVAPLSYAQDMSAKLAVCAACHGSDGNSTMVGSPSLAGQPKVFLENSLIMIREGMRDIPAMKGQLDGMSDPQIIALAKFYSAQVLKPVPGERDEALYERGQILSKQALCGTCHLPDYVGRQQMPRLAGQREDYLLHTMRQFRNNQATGRDTIMAASLYGMNDNDLKAIAQYLSQLK